MITKVFNVTSSNMIKYVTVYQINFKFLVLIILIGQYNLRKVVLAGKREAFNRYLDKNFEKGRTIAKELNITQGVAIIDLYGLNARTHACLQCKNL